MLPGLQTDDKACLSDPEDDEVEVTEGENEKSAVVSKASETEGGDEMVPCDHKCSHFRRCMTTSRGEEKLREEVEFVR